MNYQKKTLNLIAFLEKKESQIDQIVVPPPSATIHVVMPDHLVFTIKNWRSWILEVGRHYEIIIQVYSSNRMQIYPSDNLVIDAYFEPTKLPVHFQSINGSYNYLHGKEKGITLAKASLKGTRNLINNNLVVFDWVVRGEQEIELLDPIEVNKIINNRSIYYI